MRVIEGGRGAALPTLRHADTHFFIYLLEAAVTLTLDGVEHRLSPVMRRTSRQAPPIPRGSTAASRAGWLATSSGGDAARLWSQAGTATTAFSHANDGDAAADGARLRDLRGVDVAIVD